MAQAFATDLVSDCRSYESAMFHDVLNSLMSSQSAAVDQVQTKVSTTLVDGADRLERSASEASDGFRTYASEVDRIHTAARKLRKRVLESLETIRTQSAVIEDICSAIKAEAPTDWKSPPSLNMPQPALPADAANLEADGQKRQLQILENTYSASWWQAAQAWQLACDDITADATEWEGLVTERRAAEQALLNALAETEIGQLIMLGSVPGGAGPKSLIAHRIAGELWGEVARPSSVAKRHPDLAGIFENGDGSDAWDNPPDPEIVATWWRGLDESTKARLIREVPWVIGNLPGLPYTDRDSANREILKFTAQNPTLLTPAQLKLAAEVQEILAREAEEIAEYGGGRPPIQLVAFDLTTAVPRVAVGYGNSDTATQTTWEVAGMESDAHLALEGWDTASRNLYLDQIRVQGVAGSNSVIAWLGYDTPDLADTLNDDGVLSQKAAHAGAARFAAELDGNHESRSVGNGALPTINVLAHSYGTTTASVALTQTSFEVSSFTMIASAGLDTDAVPSYDVLQVAEVSPGQKAIYTTHASEDRLAPTGAGAAGRGQPNPSAQGLLGIENYSSVYEGGLSFPSDGDREQGLLPTDGHSIIGAGTSSGVLGSSASDGQGYLDKNTQSLRSIARITMGKVEGRFADSLVRTEAECSEVYLPLDGGLPVPYRVTCD